MKEIILLKMGELVLKGLNRKSFENKLIANVRRAIKPYGKFTITHAQSAVYVYPEGDADIDEAVDALSRVFGIATLSRAGECEKDMDKILPFTAQYCSKELMGARTFKVESKRSDKSFPLKSPEIAAEAGGYLLEKFPHLKVDVHSPDVVVNIEIRDEMAYVHAGRIKGAGGMPVGTNGKAMLMLSGGIDSPVAGYMAAKRGVELSCIHYFSYPYTSMQALDKVKELAYILSRYAGRMNLYIVPFTKIQEHIRKYCPDELTTLVMRRIMMEIACAKAEQVGALAVVTGESIGQVASQTMHALASTDSAATMPVLRPVIGMDKTEIVALSRKIGAFETSILPYEDCCTVFTPKHPKTRPSVEEVKAAEAAFNFAPLIAEAMDNIKKIRINFEEQE
ncbi:MAG: tRNA 4-thiouridine(8) synthase ThiI [Clostridia bacterium]|nr:tRNA 4-thiouridine(8) synthase ThiI [Clostridia bacterium]